MLSQQGAPQRQGYLLGRTPALQSPRIGDSSSPAVAAALQDLEARIARIEHLIDKDKRVSGAPPAHDTPTGTLPYTFSGMIQADLLSDMLQLVSSNAMSGVFTIESADSKSVLYFDQGQLCHAHSGKLAGEDAFFSAFATKSGKYHFVETEELPKENTISGNTQFLILEALRKMDEASA